MSKYFAGTYDLIKLNLKLDKFFIPVWVGMITLLFFVVIVSVDALFKDAQERIMFINSASVNPVLRFFAGPVTGTELANLVVDLRLLLIAIFVAIMNIFLVSRHTRQNEETGRSELVGSTVVGKFSIITAALTSSFIANILLFLSVTAVFAGYGLDKTGSIAVGMSIFGIGIVFAGVSALSSQIYSTTKAANIGSIMVLMILFLLRGVGDMFMKTSENIFDFSFHFLTWLSPFGWMRIMKPFADEDLFVFMFFIVFFLMLLVLALLLSTKRDFGGGLISVKPGKPNASRFLLHLVGFFLRIQSGSIKGWALVVGVLSVAMGAMASEASKLLEGNEQMKNLFAALKLELDFSSIFLSFAISIFASILLAYFIQSLLKFKLEEEGGQLETLLSKNISRTKLYINFIMSSLLGTAALLLLSATIMSIINAIMIGELNDQFTGIFIDMVSYLPALTLVGGFVVFLTGSLPGVVSKISWFVYVILLITGVLGEMLGLPEWVHENSLLSQIPSYLLNENNLAVLGIYSLVGIILTGFGLLFFEKRDLDIRV